MPTDNRASVPKVLRERDRGQILAIGVFLIVGLIAMSALVIEGGNAFAQQRVTQNGSDAAANAGAVVLAQRLGGVSKTDSDVVAAITGINGANGLTAFSGYYTDVRGGAIDSSGVLVGSSGNSAAAVGGGTIPPNAQGVAVTATKSFGTTIAHALGIDSFDAAADATAVTGQLAGGAFLPVVFPVSISDCDNSGGLTPFTQGQWVKSLPPATIGGFPTGGPEYIVPLCKTNAPGNGGGSFQILDLDPNKTCLEETQEPPFIEWLSFPVRVHVDTGNNCAKPISDEVMASLRLKPVLIPFCVGYCVPEGSGNNGEYVISGVAAFYIDYMDDSNNKNNTLCNAATSPYSGQPLTNIIGGNGSSSCVVGWFIDFISVGPVGSGSVGNGEAIGVQLIR